MIWFILLAFLLAGVAQIVKAARTVRHLTDLTNELERTLPAPINDYRTMIREDGHRS